ncbi:MAG: alanine racemase [Eubacterium sp.]|nr:alanine racemase [Eubacterium sp.]
MSGYGRIYATIDLDAVSYNLDSIQKKISSGTDIIAVVKADGYGHGALEISRMLEREPRVFGFAVASAEEAFALRDFGIQKPVLILGYTFAEDYEALVLQYIRPTVYSYEMALAYNAAALKAGTKALLHIKVDTGMGRIGYPVTREAADEIAEIAALPGIEIEGLFTHFARADERDKTESRRQLALYREMLTLLEDRHVYVSYRHCSNSAAIAEFSEADLDLVRAGIILYGLWPSEESNRDAICLRPVMELKSTVIHIKTLEAGSCISYGGTYRLTERKRIATIPAGYADGYPRSLSNKGYVLIRGKKAPILGRICMDQFMVDVTEIPDVKLLDPVTLLGRDGKEQISMEDLGRLSGRFNYEFACDIGKRVPRYYVCKKIE